MKRYFNECKELEARKATIILKDIIVENNKCKEVNVERKVTRAYGSKHGRDSVWGVCFDHPLSDGTIACSLPMIVGVID